MDKVNLVTVAVCTYKRPKMLTRCLNSLGSQELPRDVLLQIAVIDNDPLGSAHQPYVAFMRHCKFPSTYLQQPKRGIAAARNKAVEFARGQNADYLAFIDDDEWADIGWVAGLMLPAYQDIPIVSGKQVMHFGPRIPLWARSGNKLKAEGSRAVPAANNIRIAMSVFDRLSFNEGLGLGGGEDGELFARARAMGIPSAHTNQAITTEEAHPERHTFKGILERTHWVAAAGMRERMIFAGRTRAIAGKSLSIVTCAPAALGQAILGAAIYPFDRVTGMRAILKAGMIMARATGRWDAIRGHVPQTYQSTVGK